MSTRPIARAVIDYSTGEKHLVSDLNLAASRFRGPHAAQAFAYEERQTKAVEEMLKEYAVPGSAVLAMVGRIFVVATFLWDAIQKGTQWGDQVWFLEQHRSFPWGLSHMFLASSIAIMVFGSGAIILKRHTKWGVGALLLILIVQYVTYGQIHNLGFFLRNATVVGALLVVASDSMVPRNSGGAEYYQGTRKYHPVNILRRSEPDFLPTHA